MAGGVIRLSPARSKTLVGRILPISPPIAEALARRRARRDPDSPLVFHRDGISVRRWRTAWRTACQAAGVPTRFLHDCRRTAARNLIRASVPERVAMLLTGHKSRAIFDRYNIINEQELFNAGEQLVAYLAQQAQATPRGRAHPTGAAATRTAPALRLVRRTTAVRAGPDTARRCAAARVQATGTSRPAIVPHAATGRADAADHGYARRDSTTSSCNDRHLRYAQTPTFSGVSASAGCSVSTRVVGPLIAPYGTITTEAPDVMWGTDMTTTVTVAEGPACVFVAVDHCTAECIGLHAAKRGTRFEALEPIRQGIRERFGGIGEGVARGLRLRHDHGSNYLADDFQQEVAFFGIESSPSFVREPEGNGVAERFIRTLKENLLWVRSFATIEALRLALLAFKRTYNEQWMLEKYDYRSPAQVRRDLVGLDAAA